MTDIDFDELDRAVNSLVGAKSPEAPVPAPSPLTETQQSTMSLAAKRSSGRFMDVVHPSSDMRSAPLIPARPAAREGVTIAAPTISVTAPTLPPAPASIPDLPEVTAVTTAKNEWPDPIDFHGAVDSAVIAAVAAPAPSQALDTPFIADAKVEKRPLGAFSDVPSTPEPVTEPVNEPISEPETTPAAQDTPQLDKTNEEVVDTPMPAELGNDLLSIESDESTVGTTAGALDLSVATPTLSIPQQYSETPSTGDKPAGSIFDSDAYKKPLAHPKKKSSGWLVVLWIVILLVVGAGAGAAVYFYILPLL